MTFARAEREVFDVEAEIDRQPLSVWPGVVRTVNDRRISIAIMIWKLHIGIPAKLGSARLAQSWRHPVTAEDPMMVGAATVFVVTDIAKSTEHYRDVLGFTVTFEYGTPTSMCARVGTKLPCTCFRQAKRAGYPSKRPRGVAFHRNHDLPGQQRRQ
jgi:hypothetical protein